jgi:oligogalacturonide transporter
MDDTTSTGGSTESERSEGKLSLKTKLLFGWADVFGGGGTNIVNFFYLIFLTDVVGLAPGLAGTVVLVSKIWDAVSDPLMGIITDRTRTRFGRRRPYFMVGSVLVLVSFVMLFWPVQYASPTARFVFVLAAYLLYSTVFTVVMVPYSAMSAEITPDYHERTSVNTIRLFFSLLSSLLCAVLPMQIVQAAPSVRSGYIFMALAFGVFFSLPWVFVSIGTREPERPEGVKPRAFKFSHLIDPMRVKAFRLLVAIYICTYLGMDFMSALVPYYMTYYLGRAGALSGVLGSLVFTQIAMLPAYLKLTKRIGKSKAYVVAACLWLFGLAWFVFHSPAWPTWSIFVIAVGAGLGLSGTAVLPWTMFPDTTEAGELHSGVRAEGSFSGVMTFCRKVTSAIAFFIIGQMLELVGYVRPVNEAPQVQPDHVLLAIRSMILVFPLIFVVLAVLAARKYPITEEIHSRLRRYLRFTRGEVSENPLTQEEVEDLRSRLL